MNSTINRYVRVFIGSLFIIFGAYTMWIELLPGSFDPKFKNMMGIVLIGYGTYRIVHTYYRRESQTESNSDGGIGKEPL